MKQHASHISDESLVNNPILSNSKIGGKKAVEIAEHCSGNERFMLNDEVCASNLHVMPSEEHLQRHLLNWLDFTNKEQVFSQQTEGALKSNSPSRYVREALEVPAFHREQRQRRVGVLHIPPLWLIHRSKIHLLFKVACWLHLNVKRIKPTWKEGQIVHSRPRIFEATCTALLCMLLATWWRSETTTEMVKKVISIMTNASLQQLVSLQQPAVSATQPTWAAC